MSEHSAGFIPDPIREGRARGWKIVDGATLAEDRRLDADVVIVGSGAGGGVTAEILALSGLDVVIVEEGALFPTSIGANPQLSIHGIAARLASGLARALAGKPAGHIETRREASR